MKVVSHAFHASDRLLTSFPALNSCPGCLRPARGGIVLTGRVYIIGGATSEFGKLQRSARQLLVDTSLLALRDAGVEPDAIDGSIVSNAFGFSERQIHIGPILNTELGVPHKPSLTVESACAGGSTALNEAFMRIAGGFDDICLVAGAERITQAGSIQATDYFAMGSDYLLEGSNGATFPGLYASMAVAYMHRYGTGRDALASVSIKNHENALLNPVAHLRKRITMEDYLEAPMVAYPLGLYDCCPFSDGASALLVASEKAATELGRTDVEILASRRAGSPAPLQERDDLTSIPAAVTASSAAFRSAHITPEDVDVAEVHDCFTIAEIIATEDIGFFRRGEGGMAAFAGETSLEGSIPVNPSGGLKAKGHPVSATGIAQMHELYLQLMGHAGQRQVEDAEIALAHNVGATGGSCTIHIARRR